MADTPEEVAAQVLRDVMQAELYGDNMDPIITAALRAAEARGFAKGLEAATVHFEEAGKLAAKNADLDKANEVLSRTIADLQSQEGAALAELRTRLVRWRARAKKLVQLARDAQFEVIAKTIHHTALISVMTPDEYAEFKRRIRADNERRKAARALAPQAPPEVAAAEPKP